MDAHVGSGASECEELGVGRLAPERVDGRDHDRRAGRLNRLHEVVAGTDVGDAPVGASDAHTPTQPRIVQPAARRARPIRSSTSVASLPSPSTITRSASDPRSRSCVSIRSTTKRPACTAPVASTVASTVVAIPIGPAGLLVDENDDRPAEQARPHHDAMFEHAAHSDLPGVPALEHGEDHARAADDSGERDSRRVRDRGAGREDEQPDRRRLFPSQSVPALRRARTALNSPWARVKPTTLTSP